MYIITRIEAEMRRGLSPKATHDLPPRTIKGWIIYHIDILSGWHVRCRWHIMPYRWTASNTKTTMCSTGKIGTISRYFTKTTMCAFENVLAQCLDVSRSVSIFCIWYECSLFSRERSKFSKKTWQNRGAEHRGWLFFLMKLWLWRWLSLMETRYRGRGIYLKEKRQKSFFSGEKNSSPSLSGIIEALKS